MKPSLAPALRRNYLISCILVSFATKIVEVGGGSLVLETTEAEEQRVFELLGFHKADRKRSREKFLSQTGKDEASKTFEVLRRFSLKGVKNRSSSTGELFLMISLAPEVTNALLIQRLFENQKFGNNSQTLAFELAVFLMSLVTCFLPPENIKEKLYFFKRTCISCSPESLTSLHLRVDRLLKRWNDPASLGLVERPLARIDHAICYGWGSQRFQEMFFLPQPLESSHSAGSAFQEHPIELERIDPLNWLTAGHPSGSTSTTATTTTETYSLNSLY